MKKIVYYIILGVSLISTVGAGCESIPLLNINKAQQKKMQNANTAENTAPSTNTAPVTNSASNVDAITTQKTYANSGEHFSFIYPSNYKFAEQDNDSYSAGSLFVESEGKTVPVLVSVAMPNDLCVGTNFLGAWFTVSNNKNITKTEDCKLFKKNGNIVSMAQEETISGTQWYRGSVGGASAGTIVLSRVYHKMQNNICYEVGLHMATSDLNNYYPKGSVRAVNEAEVWGKLQKIFNTFKFTK